MNNNLEALKAQVKALESEEDEAKRQRALETDIGRAIEASDLEPYKKQMLLSIYVTMLNSSYDR